jgi:hypothetical protein
MQRSAFIIHILVKDVVTNQQSIRDTSECHKPAGNQHSCYVIKLLVTRSEASYRETKEDRSKERKKGETKGRSRGIEKFKISLPVKVVKAQAISGSIQSRSPVFQRHFLPPSRHSLMMDA